MNPKHIASIISSAAAAVVLVSPVAQAEVTTNTAGAVQQGQNGGVNNPAATISLSGQTALRNFTTSAALTYLEPAAGTSFTLYNGTNFVPTTYYVPTTTNTATKIQLASRNFTIADVGVGATSSATAANVQTHSGLRIEWHEQGSLDGFYDLINDQVGYNGSPISNYSNRGPSGGNPTWVNGTQYTGAGASNGLPISGTSGLAAYNTYNPAVIQPATGKNLTGGQNRIQIAIGEYGPENFAFSGSPTVTTSPNSAGYGLGNPALKPAAQLSGQGVKNSRQAFQNTSIANLSTDKIDPQTGANYPVGPWNTAGADNIDSKQVAATAVTISANPGTGLKRLNLADAQWLQTAGRLSNGAEFNYVSRVANTGQRNVTAINTGIDPTWAVGENDGGDTGTTALATAQKQIGPNIRFSGKTAGGESRNAIQNSRFGVGALSVAEARGASFAAPVRALDIDFVNLVDSNAFTHLDADSFLNGTYKAILISHYNTIKAPNAAYAGDTAAQWAARTTAQTGIKGDTGPGTLYSSPNGNVASFINNVVGSTTSAASGITTSSANNPADGLIANGFFLPGLLNFKRIIDGGPQTPNPLSPAQQALQTNIKNFYPSIFTTDGSPGASTETSGVSATYGAVVGTYLPVNGSIPITEKDSGGSPVADGTFGPRGNYLAGNFNQDGRRDYSAIKEGVNAAISLAKAELAAGTPGKSTIFTADGGNTNSTVITSHSGSPGWTTSANTKGDLIVLGDINSDGAYDGQDVYLLSRGAALSDNSGTDHLGTAATFSDQLRNPNAKLNKNAALDYAKTQTTALGVDDGANAARGFLRKTGRANLTGAAVPTGATLISTNTDGTFTYTFDFNGVNAFNKTDVNRDGKANFYDAAIVDGFNGKATNSLSDQLGAVVATNQNDGGLTFYGTGGTPTDPTLDSTTDRRQFSLLDAELTDDKTIGAADVTVANTALTGTGNDEWYAGNSYKVGPNTIAFNRTASTVTLGTGAKLNIKAGTVENQGADVFTSGGNSIDIDTAAAGTFKVSSGSNTTVSHITGVGSTLATGAGTKLNAKFGIQQSSLTIASGATISVNVSGASTGVTKVNSLSIDSTSKLDLHDNDLVVEYGVNPSSYSTIVNKVKSGLALLGGTDANVDNIGDAGIGSTEVDLQTISGTVLAVVDDGDPNIAGGITSLSGYAIPNPAQSVLVKYTWFGDANLDGVVDGSDYALTDTGFTSGGSLGGWVFGDYDYNGAVDGGDYALQDTGFIGQTGTLPEPSTIGLLGLGSAALVRRRRRKAE